MECKDNCEHRGCQLQDPDHDGETLYGTGRRVRVHDDEDGCIGTSHEWQSRMMGKKKKKEFLHAGYGFSGVHRKVKMEGDTMRAAIGNFLRVKKFMLVLMGPGEVGGLVRARASRMILSATDPAAIPTLVARRGLDLQAARVGGGEGLGGLMALLLVTIMEEVE